MNTSSIAVPISSQGGHSARVNLRLLVNELSLPVAQLGPDFVLLDNPVDHAPAVAAVVMQVDESERSWQVRLPHGISAADNRVPIVVLT
jgi:hypothetical protein